MAFLGVDDRQPAARKAADQPPDGRHDRREPVHVVAEALAEAAGLDEVALHVDDDERGRRRLENGRRKARASITAINGAPPCGGRSPAMSALSPRRLIDDPPFRHDEDAVGELEDLVEVLADQEHRSAAVPLLPRCANGSRRRRRNRARSRDWRRPGDRPRRSARGRAPRAARCRRRASRSANPSRPS